MTETVERSEWTESRVQHRPCTKTMAQAGSFISKVKIKAIFKRDATLLQVTMGHDWLNERQTIGRWVSHWAGLFLEPLPMPLASHLRASISMEFGLLEVFDIYTFVASVSFQ